MQRFQNPANAGIGAPGPVSQQHNLTGGSVPNGLPTSAGPGLRPPGDPGVETILASINDIKNSITILLQHIETQADFLSWPVILDRYNLITSQMVKLTNAMKSDKIPDLRRLTVVPFLVSPDADPMVEKLTEGRMSTVNHENVPSYLRTKLDPEVETRFENAFSKVPNEKSAPDAVQKADKQIQSLNKIVNALIEQCTVAQSESESKTAKAKLPQAYDVNDTTALLAAVMTGKNLPSIHPQGVHPQGGHPGQKFAGFTGQQPPAGNQTVPRQ